MFSALSSVKTVIGVPGKVVYLHYITAYCACLSVVLVAFRFGGNLAGRQPCRERASHSALSVCCRNIFCCVLCIFFPTWCLCWDFKFNCIDSWSLYSYFPFKTKHPSLSRRVTSCKNIPGVRNHVFLIINSAKCNNRISSLYDSADNRNIVVRIG